MTAALIQGTQDSLNDAVVMMESQSAWEWRSTWVTGTPIATDLLSNLPCTKDAPWKISMVFPIFTCQKKKNLNMGVCVFVRISN